MDRATGYMADDSLPFAAGRFYGAKAAVPDATRVFTSSCDVAELRSRGETSARAETCACADNSAHDDHAAWNVAESDLEAVCSMDRSFSHRRRFACDGVAGNSHG
ncbi:hypothetical protein CLOP_g15298, partial [Closterium sp. NIES-67]